MGAGGKEVEDVSRKLFFHVFLKVSLQSRVNSMEAGRGEEVGPPQPQTGI